MPETNNTDGMENNEESADMEDNTMDETDDNMDGTVDNMDDSEETDTANDDTADVGVDVEADVATDADTATPDVEIDVTGTNFSFSPDRIEVNQGDIVKINFSSEMWLHDWVLEGVENVATEQVNPGTVTSVTFTAWDPGEYTFYCSVGNHREQGMVGTLVVSGT